MAKQLLWNTGWEFSKMVYEEGEVTKPEKWEKVELPHDWLIYNTKQLYEDSIGWYRKKFTYQPDDLLRVIRFDGVYMDSTVYVNGTEVGCWKYGYSTFEFDITQYLREGENEMTVRVLHHSPNSRWYSGAGIYRNVWLLQMSKTHLCTDGIYITPKLEEDVWYVETDSEIQLASEKIDKIKQTIFDSKNQVVASVAKAVNMEASMEYSKVVISQEMQVQDPLLWDINKGNLYTLQTDLMHENHVVDSSRQKFGFRTITMDPNHGLFINGRHTKIKGSCEHHGFGCLGSVANKAALRRKLTILRQMGVNAIRTAHNMPSNELMELADEMGFLIYSESFDMWERSKNPYDYARFFKEWWKKDIKSWVRRDRNHPSLFMWSIGNEIYDTHADTKGVDITKELLEEVLLHDYKKHATVTFASNYLRWENTQTCAEVLKVVGYNYTEALYETHHKEHNDWIIYGSETASMLASRNIYHFPLDQKILCEDDEQCSSLGNCCAGWGAQSYTDNIIADRDTPFSLGQFIWSGFDYFGEPTPYHTKNSYFGQIDTAGFPKDSFYIYQAEWTDYKENPMIHIFPYWDFNENQMIDVCVCSNAPRVELFFNEKSLGCVEIDHEHGTDLVPHWRIPYQYGELQAKAYDLEGKVIAKDNIHSFGDTYEIRLTPDKYEVSAKENDLIFIEIRAYDKEGYPVENANNRINIEVTGGGRLVGIDNGDSTDFDQVKGNSKRLFGGKLLAVIAAGNGERKEICVKATSPNVKSGECKLQQVKGELEHSVIEEKQINPVAEGVGSEIPIRKISLLCEKEPKIDEKNRTLKVRAVISPANATYTDLEWKVVTNSGIETASASVRANGKEATVTSTGDGVFQLRCLAKNGGRVASVRSHMEIHVEGLGKSRLNPYQKLSAGLCQNRPDGLAEGIDKGIRFLGKKKVAITYENMDFGKSGSKEITMSIFKYEEPPVSFQVWQGEKLEEGELLLEGDFKEAQGWMDFKEKTYQLNKKIKGLNTIHIVSTDNFQLKDFQFVKLNRALEILQATEHDKIFGDSFTITSEAVTEIGNNVTLVYQEMDFGEDGVDKFVLCGKSDLSSNSIHVKFQKENDTQTQLVEFEGSYDYIEREYTFKRITGKQEVRFVFLPGSQFDFKWFQFKKN